MRVFLDEHRDMLAYLSMMAIRLTEMRRVLRKTGSIYVHCDASASHYLKLILDALFGPENFRREIVWRSGWVSGFKARTRNWVRNHDTLLYYLRERREGFTFNKQLAYRPHAEDYRRRGGGENKNGVAIDDVWDEDALYSPSIKSFSGEKLGYMTQKPLALLERIVSVSSNSGETVLTVLRVRHYARGRGGARAHVDRYRRIGSRDRTRQGGRIKSSPRAHGRNHRAKTSTHCPDPRAKPKLQERKPSSS